MKRTIGICLWSLMPMTFTQRKPDRDIFKAVADMGVEYIDFIEDYVPCHPHANLAEMAELKRQVAEFGLKAGQVWFYMDLIAGMYATSFKRITEDLKDYLYITEQMGARFLCIPLILNRPGLSVEDGYRQFTNIIRECLPVAEKLNIPITLEYARAELPPYALRLMRDIPSPYLLLTPDFEAWRLSTEDIPLAHIEAPDAAEQQPAAMDTFVAALPYAQHIHAKFLSIDENGEEPHYPIAEMMAAINESKADHHFSVEYEGWIPDIHPHLDCVTETKKCVDLIRRYIK